MGNQKKRWKISRQANWLRFKFWAKKFSPLAVFFFAGFASLAWARWMRGKNEIQGPLSLIEKWHELSAWWAQGHWFFLVICGVPAFGLAMVIRNSVEEERNSPEKVRLEEEIADQEAQALAKQERALLLTVVAESMDDALIVEKRREKAVKRL